MKIKPMAAIIEMLQKIAERPWVYDWIQTAAGQKRSLKRISLQTAAMHPKTVVDVGGGTGAWRCLWPEDCRYVCLDIEMPKLRGFRSKVPTGLAVLSDATRMPISAASADVVVCIAVTHHLTNEMLEQVLDEALRILKADGQLILLDPVLNRARWMGRLLWRLDRGSYPRSAEELRDKLERKFKMTHWDRYAVYHEYVFGIGVRLQR
jgi:ubiquinone/menaquinone biosynthesis C-methylase UbiE